jgi:hypothetical protein
MKIEQAVLTEQPSYIYRNISSITIFLLLRLLPPTTICMNLAAGTGHSSGVDQRYLI